MKLSKSTSSRQKLLEHFSLDEQSRLYSEITRSNASRPVHDKSEAGRNDSSDL